MRANNFKDEVGNKYGRLTAIRYCGTSEKRKALWECQCDCGRLFIATGCKLRSGATKHCGCLANEHHGTGYRTHGMTAGNRGKYNGLYKTWTGMVQRCTNPNHVAYHRYGGRGVVVCDEWSKFIPFMEWAQANGFEKGLEIDRMDNNGNYTPDNCRFVTGKANIRNRRNTLYVTYKGETKALATWAEILGMPYYILYQRNKHGWDTERAFTEPIHKKLRGDKLAPAEWVTSPYMKAVFYEGRR